MIRTLPLRFTLPALFVVVAGCTPTNYFNSPNDVFRKEGTVHLLNGNEEKGKLTIMLDTGHDANNFVQLSVGGRDETILIDSIRYYQVGKELYFPKKIDLDDNSGNHIVFLRRLTGEGARLDLYELFRQGKNTFDGSDLYLYFISRPTQNRLETWSISSSNFFPGFDEKMSSFVAGCPELAFKIKQKQKGYSLTQLSLSLKKAEVFRRIVEEYNSCTP